MRKSAVIYLLLIFHPIAWSLPPCTNDDLEFKYTECEASNERWRVRAPKTGKHCAVTVPTPPVPGPKCDASCSAGQYLDVTGDQQCKSCPAGTYSVGGGVRYDQWDTLPEGLSLAQHGILQFDDANCSTAAQKSWKLRGEYIEGLPSKCSADLTIVVKLVQQGTLTVKYMNTYSGVMGIVKATSLCQTTAVEKESTFDGFNFLHATKGDRHGSVTLKMAPGKNRITFSVVGVAATAPGIKLAILSIEINGMPFTSKCTPCKPGYYSSVGSKFCTRCGQDTHAPKSGSSGCIPCSAIHFAPPGSSECKTRPVCTTSDYYKSVAPCTNGTTHVTYDWLTPQICNRKLAKSASLPPPGISESCPPCNPGEALDNGSGLCSYCPEGHYSDGSKPCQLCPLHTEARKSLNFKRFDVMPHRLHTSCIETSGGGSFCDRQTTWVPRGSYIQVAQDIADEQFAVLNINVSHFASSPIDGRVYGTFTFKFDIICKPTDPCLLYLMEDRTSVRSLHSWNKTAMHIVYTHKFTDPDVSVISLAFRKSVNGRPDGSMVSKNTVKVYEMSLTNTQEGGTSACTDCMLGGAGYGCRSCKTGEVIITNNSTKERSCAKCPPNNIVVDSFTCKPCGAGLVNNADYTTCVSNCEFVSTDGMKFDFTPLAGSQAYDGVKMFTADGTSYHHSFHFIVCGAKSKPALAAKCVNNATDSLYWETAQSVSSMVCRETVLPAETVTSIQPTSLGDTLANVTINDKAERSKLTEQGGVHIEDDELSIHYHYVTKEQTGHCPDGLSTTITLICDTREADKGTMKLPPSCVGGTCDGCHYQLVWRTVLACPKCDESAYEKIVGECSHGSQTVRYLPHKYCPMTDALRSKKSTQECTLLNLPIKLAIVGSAVVGILLLVCAICCWKRSKSLEYKYMKLVEGAQGSNGELPAAETCAWSEDDEEEDPIVDRVAFKTKGDQLFGKLGNKGKGDGFEKMKLVGSSLPEI